MPSPKNGKTVTLVSPQTPRSASEAGDASTGSASATVAPEPPMHSHHAKHPAKHHAQHHSQHGKVAPAHGGNSAPPGPQPKKFLRIRWGQTNAWCSDPVTLTGSTENYTDGDTESAQVIRAPANTLATTVNLTISGNAFNANFPLVEVLPEKVGGSFPKVVDLNAMAGGQKTPAPLHMHLIPSLTKLHCTTGKFPRIKPQFDLSCTDYVLLLASNIQYVKGWARYIIDLQGVVTPEPGGKLNATWDNKSNWRWSQVGAAGKQQFWDGARWVDVPREWLDPKGEFKYGIAVWKEGTRYKSQTGIDYPQALTDWNPDTPANRQTLDAWVTAIKNKWGGVFEIKRTDCKSTATQCCRYKLNVDVKFEPAPNMQIEVIVLAEGDVRANSGMWPLGRPAATATHEWGHHLGNPDEYDKQQDPTYEDPSDGLVHGLDATSVMGDKEKGTKKRHYSSVLKHLSEMVQQQYTKSYTYECRAPGA